MVAWRFSSTAMKAEILPAPCPFCGSTNPGIEVVTARWNDRWDGDALRALREMAHDMDLLLELNAALKMETQWLAQGIRTQDQEHAAAIESFGARVRELIVERDRYKARAEEKRMQRTITVSGMARVAALGRAGHAELLRQVRRRLRREHGYARGENQI